MRIRESRIADESFLSRYSTLLRQHKKKNPNKPQTLESPEGAFLLAEDLLKQLVLTYRNPHWQRKGKIQTVRRASLQCGWDVTGPGGKAN